MRIAARGLRSGVRTAYLSAGFGVLLLNGLWGLDHDPLAPAAIAAALAGLASIGHRLLPSLLFAAVTAGSLRQPISPLQLVLGLIGACLAATSAVAPVARVALAGEGPAGVEIRTLGTLSVRSGEAELAPGLLERPTLAWLWAWLLVAELHSPGCRTSRAALGRELNPKLGRAAQRDRLRRRLGDLQRELDPRLAALIVAEADQLGFLAASCAVDLLELRGVVARVRARGGLDSELARRADALCEGVWQPFLAGCEDLLPDSGGVLFQRRLLELRREADHLRVELALALVTWHQTAGRVAAAASLLRQAHDRRPAPQEPSSGGPLFPGAGAGEPHLEVL